MTRSTGKRTPASVPAPSQAIEQMYAHPGFLLRRAHQIAASVFDQEINGLITPPQFSALTLIHLLPGIDQISVCRIIGLDRNTVAVVIGNLVKAGWVRRTIDPEDGRRHRLEITESGLTVVTSTQKMAEKSERRLLSAFNAAEATEFVRLLRRFVDSFNDTSRTPIDDTALPLAQLRQQR